MKPTLNFVKDIDEERHDVMAQAAVLRNKRKALLVAMILTGIGVLASMIAGSSVALLIAATAFLGIAIYVTHLNQQRAPSLVAFNSLGNADLEQFVALAEKHSGTPEVRDYVKGIQAQNRLPVLLELNNLREYITSISQEQMTLRVNQQYRNLVDRFNDFGTPEARA